jgi:hypothetical protein
MLDGQEGLRWYVPGEINAWSNSNMQKAVSVRFRRLQEREERECF